MPTNVAHAAGYGDEFPGYDPSYENGRPNSEQGAGAFYNNFAVQHSISGSDLLALLVYHHRCVSLELDYAEVEADAEVESK